jgi:hypothetical protein
MMSNRVSWVIIAAISLFVTACSSESSDKSVGDASVDTRANGSDVREETTDEPDAGDTVDLPEMDAGSDAQERSDTVERQESEPNNGEADGKFDSISTGGLVSGSISPAGDVDVFKLDVPPGKVYFARLDSENSRLQGHLTVFDAGRDGEQMGSDYRKIVSSEAGGVVQFLAMGEGGYFLAVRDRRNVGTEAGAGGDDFNYELSVEAVDKSQFSRGSVVFGGQQGDTLDGPAHLALYQLPGSKGDEIEIDIQATGDADLRALVYSETTRDWIARHDDRGINNTDPIIDAPLTAEGPFWLLIENIDETASGLGFNYTATRKEE